MKGCVDCGYKQDHRALQFDHIIETEKTRTVASCCFASWDVIKREIAKCVIRCANCHAIKTHERKQYGGVSRRVNPDHTADAEATGLETRGSP